MISSLMFSSMLSSQANAFGFSWSKNKLRDVQIIVENNANDFSAVEMDLVFVMDENLANKKTFAEMSNQLYFQDKQVLLMNYGPGINVVNLQMPPGFTAEEIKLPKGHKQAYRVLVFTNFIQKLDEPMPTDISDIKKLRIHVKGSQLDLTEL